MQGARETTLMHAGCKRDNSHFLYYVLITPEVDILCRP